MNKQLKIFFAMMTLASVQTISHVEAQDVIQDMHYVGSDSVGSEVHQYFALWGNFTPGDFMYVSCYRMGFTSYQEIGGLRLMPTRQVNIEIVRQHPSGPASNCVVYRSERHADGTVYPVSNVYNFSLEATELGTIRKNGY